MDDSQNYAQQFHDQTAKLVDIANQMKDDADTYRLEVEELAGDDDA